MDKKNISTPSKDKVEYYLKEWLKKANYVAQENALNKLFWDTFPKNDNLDEILIKVSCLNDFYSTNIRWVFDVARHIKKLNVDERLKDNDMSLVQSIARVEVSGKNDKNDKKIINFYSFASKYCSHHKDKAKEFPIYDSYVKKVLLYFAKRDGFYDFKKADLKEYATFKDVLIKFSAFYDIKQYDLKEIDRYLWQLGKECFKKQKS
ncbi:hypothetical protein CCY99_02440 [Helicobacter sp. 16-1353]|uniref:hypothetical protein n=1 Tax=Helicobacter sp. 16-1353 TaxID=2004996 RepID=UPI000DCDC9D0|nr:hypothetical protein [Helicobacter sp. 16-1353]RAX54641.1 hypothetical protein CCY99_02440 [Helicobacter sp. 16-1353]